MVLRMHPKQKRTQHNKVYVSKEIISIECKEISSSKEIDKMILYPRRASNYSLKLFAFHAQLGLAMRFI